MPQKFQQLKKSKKFSKSSKKWLLRQVNDQFVEKAKNAGWRSRSTFKIIEIDEKFKIPYTNILKSESHDAMLTITRLARQDPAWSSWDCYKGEAKGCSGDTYANTIIVQYKSSAGVLQAALFAFRENKISDWYGFGNAMRLISYGARPAAAPQEPIK